MQIIPVKYFLRVLFFMRLFLSVIKIISALLIAACIFFVLPVRLPADVFSGSVSMLGQTADSLYIQVLRAVGFKPGAAGNGAEQNVPASGSGLGAGSHGETEEEGRKLNERNNNEHNDNERDSNKQSNEGNDEDGGGNEETTDAIVPGEYFMTRAEVASIDGLSLKDKLTGISIISKVEKRHIDAIRSMAGDGVTYEEMREIRSMLEKYLTEEEIGTLCKILLKK